jgi:hypothetical protein
MQNEFNCYFFIADYHSLTTHPTPNDLHSSVKRVLAEYIALGLDPDKSTLYLQSDLPQTAELYMFFNMNAYLGELQRLTSFKDKIRDQPDNVNAGILTYPVLMAADILLHRAAKVPVGKDQEQHLEMAYGEKGFTKIAGGGVVERPVLKEYSELSKQAAEAFGSKITSPKARAKYDAAAAAAGREKTADDRVRQPRQRARWLPARRVHRLGRSPLAGQNSSRRGLPACGGRGRSAASRAPW